MKNFLYVIAIINLAICGYFALILFGHDLDAWKTSVSTHELGWLTHLHWRSVELAGSAWYATIYDRPEDAASNFEREVQEISAEAAQRLREGWVLEHGPDGMPRWRP